MRELDERIERALGSAPVRYTPRPGGYSTADRFSVELADGRRVFVKSADADPLNLIDPLSLKNAGSASADSVTQIGTNNGLRSALRTTVAHFSLSSPEVAVRLDAVREMSRSLDEPTVALLRQRLGLETNSSVKKEIETALALAALDTSDSGARLQAIATLKQSVSQDVRNRLALLLDKSPDGGYVEKDEKVRQAATSAVATIDRWRAFYSGFQTLFFGLSLGSVLVLIAIGLAITFGVMGVINMAHGELMMLTLCYTQCLITQMAQTAVCNRHHTLDQQLCRWLLLSLDRLPSNTLTMTQELIANMLGVRREGVTEAAGKLQKLRLIEYSRGRITILDRPKLEQLCCECYAVVKKETDRLLPHAVG